MLIPMKHYIDHWFKIFKLWHKDINQTWLNLKQKLMDKIIEVQPARSCFLFSELTIFNKKILFQWCMYIREISRPSRNPFNNVPQLPLTKIISLYFQPSKVAYMRRWFVWRVHSKRTTKISKWTRWRTRTSKHSLLSSKSRPSLNRNKTISGTNRLRSNRAVFRKMYINWSNAGHWTILMNLCRKVVRARGRVWEGARGGQRLELSLMKIRLSDILHKAKLPKVLNIMEI